MRFPRLGVLILGFLGSAFAQLDAYGGLNSKPCTNATGHFKLLKSSQRWWLCTPAGHKFFFQGVGGASTPDNLNVVTKYGSAATWATQMVSFIKSVNFNGVGELSDNWINDLGGASTATIPFLQTFEPTLYSTVNLNNYASHPVKNYMWGENGFFTQYRGAGCIDAFDPQYPTYVSGFYTNDAGVAGYLNSAYSIGALSDDTDFVCGFGGTPDLPTLPGDNHKGHLGIITLLTSPVQTFNAGSTYNTTLVQYSDTKVYSKVAMTSPPTTCAFATPCSLRDYLAKKYGTIGALNTAWGSSYTTFDSAGTETSTTCATGDGIATTFSCTLPHTNISPLSVSISVGGTQKGGDCPWFQSACNISGQLSTPYTCGTLGNCQGSFNGASGTTLQTGTGAPWLASTQITEANNAGSSLPPASYWVRTAWHGCSFPTPSREIGNTYNVDAHPQVSVSTQNLSADNPGCATGVDIYVSCRVVSGGAAFGCVAAASGQPAETLQASNVAYPGGSWTEPTTGLVGGAALPSPATSIDYGSGAVSLAFTSAPANGAAISLTYTFGGWMFGSGLMDEDGRNTAWIGTEERCLKNQGSFVYSCTANANVNLGTDLDAWQGQYGARYFSAAATGIHTAYPNAIYWCNDTLGDWWAPPRKELLQAANPYCDGLFTLVPGPTSIAPAGEPAAALSYVTQYFGDKPVMLFSTLEANPDSPMAAISDSNVNILSTSTQPGRAASWYSMVNQELSTVGYNGTYQFVGVVWWGLSDYSSEGFDWGIFTTHDNAYNAHDAASGTLACSSPLGAYTCGSEPAPGGAAVRPFGDLFGGATGVTAANLLWQSVGDGAPGLRVTHHKLGGGRTVH